MRGAANAERKALEADTRAWLTADFCLDTREPIAEVQVQALGPDEAVRHRMDRDVDRAHHGGIGPVCGSGVIVAKAVDPSVYTRS